MAGFSEKIRLIFDVDGASATSSFGKLRTSIADADGAMGKAKAGAAGLGGMLKENMASAAVAAGVALVAFGVKAVGAFTDAATAARELGDATGLSTEDASRWIAVADDMEVSAESLTTGLGKIAKTLDNSKWAEYGIATRDAGGRARDTNDILLDSFDALGRITNETQRAKVGNELFGKGYASLAPLIGKTRTEYEGMLKAVDGGQVITEKEAEKAERMRLAQDALSDALESVTLATGEFVANLAPLITLLADVVGVITQVQDKTEDMARSLVGLNDGPLAGIKVGFGNAAAAADAAAAAVRAVSKDVRDSEEAVGGAKQAVKDLDAAYKELTGSLSQREAWLGVLDDLDEFAFKMNSGELSSREQEQATIDLKQSLIEYTASLDKLPAKKETEILALINEGEYEKVRAKLAALERTLYPTVSVGGGRAYSFDTGGVVPGPRGAPVMAMVHGGETILPTHKTGTPGASLGGVTVNVVAYGTNGMELGRQIQTELLKLRQRGVNT